jgi:hypothetical protein
VYRPPTCSWSLSSINARLSRIRSRNNSKLPSPVRANVDVAESDGWRKEISSVAVYSQGGDRFWTGALINNAAQDGTPYFLTRVALWRRRGPVTRRVLELRNNRRVIGHSRTDGWTNSRSVRASSPAGSIRTFVSHYIVGCVSGNTISLVVDVYYCTDQATSSTLNFTSHCPVPPAVGKCTVWRRLPIPSAHSFFLQDF